MPLGDSITAWPDSYRGPLYRWLISTGRNVDFVGSQSWGPTGGGDADHQAHGGYTIGPDANLDWQGNPGNLAGGSCLRSAQMTSPAGVPRPPTRQHGSATSSTGSCSWRPGNQPSTPRSTVAAAFAELRHSSAHAPYPYRRAPHPRPGCPIPKTRPFTNQNHRKNCKSWGLNHVILRTQVTRPTRVQSTGIGLLVFGMVWHERHRDA